jgi:hypothetical protein
MTPDRNGKLMIPRGALVRVKTTNGGDITARLGANHYPTYDAEIDAGNGRYFVIPCWRIETIEQVGDVHPHYER